MKYRKCNECGKEFGYSHKPPLYCKLCRPIVKSRKEAERYRKEKIVRGQSKPMGEIHPKYLHRHWEENNETIQNDRLD